jgi:hypothetical protein
MKGSDQMKIPAIAMIYAALIIKGRKKFSEVPDKIKDQVKAALTELGEEDLAEE